ncbi:hypothetical protein P4S68_14845 [Pseudoalteromonas sp. Hal099]
MLRLIQTLLATSLLFTGFMAQSYEIEDLGDGLHRFIDDRHRSVFLITPLRCNSYRPT